MKNIIRQENTWSCNKKILSSQLELKVIWMREHTVENLLRIFRPSRCSVFQTKIWIKNLDLNTFGPDHRKTLVLHIGS